jgi:hypothetical protein
MVKAIKVTNSYDQVIAIVDNATQALKAVEEYGSATVETKLGHLNKGLKLAGYALVWNCLDVMFRAEVIEGSALEIRLEKQFLNMAKLQAHFKETGVI